MRKKEKEKFNKEAQIGKITSIGCKEQVKHIPKRYNKPESDDEIDRIESIEKTLQPPKENKFTKEEEAKE